MTACPPADLLSELLSDELSDERRQPLEVHVGECGVCQQTLLQLAGDWSRWQRLLSADTQTLAPASGPDALPVTVLDRLKAVPFPGPPAANGAAWPHVPGFDILDELGRGGTAVVYKARQRNLGRLVALKMILTGRHASADRRARFRLEAEAVARLHHPNIVQIFETNEHDGLPYCVLELVDGGSLADRINGAPQPAEPAAALVQTLASALAVAHQNRIVHRDLKPANILLQDPGAAQDSFGTPKIADFGLALVLDDDSAPTRSGDVIGTPSYMAPEQAQGRRAAIGPATDLYALGAILYELLTGRPPFRAATAVDTLVQVSFDEPVPPTRFQPQVPRDLETICLKCLQKDPARRYASAEDLAADLQRFLRNEPIRARPAGLVERVHKWVRRRPLVAGLLTLVVGVSLLGVGGIAAALVEARAAQRNEADQRAAAEAATTQAEAALDRAERSVYLGALHQARSQWQLNNVRAAGQLLDGCDPARRGWAWHYLRNLGHADLLTVAESGAPYVGGLAYSPDGRWLAAGGGSPFAPQHGVVQVLDAETGAVRWRRADRPCPVWGVAFSPDGRQVAACGGDWMRPGRGELLLYDTATGKTIREFSSQVEGPGRGVAFSPDGRRLASASIDEIVRVWDAATGAESCRVRCQAGASNVAFSPDGRLLLTGAENGVQCWNAADGAPVRKITTEGGLFALAGDGRRLITAGRGGTVRVYDTADVATRSAALVDVLAGHATDILALAFGPDGRQIASAGADSTVRVGTLAGGMEPRSVWRGHLGRVAALAFHPDGHRLASGGQQPGDVKIWDMTRPAECTIAANLGAPMRDVEALAYTADDRELLALGLGGLLARADSATGAVELRQRIGTTIAWQVPAVRATFAAQGRRLLAVSAENPQHVNVWDVAAERITQSFAEHTARIWHIATDRDGRIVASAGFAVVDGSSTRELKLWDSATGKVHWAETTTRQRTLALAVSPDGARFAEAVQTPAGPTVRLDSVTSPTQTMAPAPTGGGAVRALAFSHDGTRLAGAAERGAVVVWDAATGQPVHDRPLEGMPGIGDLAFSPDGKALAAVNRDRVQVWDLASGQVLLYLRGAPQRTTDNGFNPRLVWSADGTRLAASCWDRTVAVFDAADVAGETGKARLRLQAANRRFAWHLSQLGGSPDGWNAGAEAFHRRRVQDQEPPTLELRRQRGNYFARLRQWDRVLPDFTPAPGAAAAEAQETLLERSLLLLHAGDAAGYRRLVEAALAAPRDPRDIESHWRLVRAGTLAPLGDAATAQALAAAKHLGAVLPHERTALDYLGLTLLRAGKLPEAADCFRRSIRTDSRELANIGLALVLLRQGDRTAAQKHLAWIDEWLQGPANRPPAADMPCGEQWDWRGWLAVNQLRQEALSQPDQ